MVEGGGSGRGSCLEHSELEGTGGRGPRQEGVLGDVGMRTGGCRAPLLREKHTERSLAVQPGSRPAGTQLPPPAAPAAPAGSTVSSSVGRHGFGRVSLPPRHCHFLDSERRHYCCPVSGLRGEPRSLSCSRTPTFCGVWGFPALYNPGGSQLSGALRHKGLRGSIGCGGLPLFSQ